MSLTDSHIYQTVVYEDQFREPNFCSACNAVGLGEFNLNYHHQCHPNYSTLRHHQQNQRTLDRFHHSVTVDTLGHSQQHINSYEPFTVFPYDLKASTLKDTSSRHKSGRKLSGLLNCDRNGRNLGSRGRTPYHLTIALSFGLLVILGAALLVSFLHFLMPSQNSVIDGEPSITQPNTTEKAVYDFSHNLDDPNVEFEQSASASESSAGEFNQDSSSWHANEVFGEFRIINLPYKSTLRNSSSPDYMFLSAQLLTALKRFFAENVPSLYKDLNETNIVAFRKGENFGLNGIIAELKLIVISRRHVSRHVGLALLRGLDRTKGALGDFFVIDLRTLRFSDSSETSNSRSHGVWSEWSEWSSCAWSSRTCDSTRIRSRQRKCLRRDNPAEEIGVVFCPGLLALEIRDCECPFKEVECSQTERCRADTEVCLLEADILGRDFNEARCRAIRDPDDPRGCGGHCSGPGQLCRPLSPGSSVYQCIEERPEEGACLEHDEWRCHDGLCIPREKLCDGHFNCYDGSDEAQAECSTCPLSQGHFHCGNKTSCLPPHKRCNGMIDCWDSSDEKDCLSACSEQTQFTCASGLCIDRSKFCNGIKDCPGWDDEPAGCILSA